MRVLITASRDWRNRDAVWRELAHVLMGVSRLPTDRVLTVVHGDCPTGGDRMAREWCEKCEDMITGLLEIDFHEERHPADWKRYGKRAGFIRNQHMVNLGADLCLGFLMPCTKQECQRAGYGRHESHGASHTTDQACLAGIETRVIRWEGGR